MNSPIRDADRPLTMGDIDEALHGAMGKYTTDLEFLATVRKFHCLKVHKEGKRYYFLNEETFARYQKNGGKWAYAD